VAKRATPRTTPTTIASTFVSSDGWPAYKKCSMSHASWNRRGEVRYCNSQNSKSTVIANRQAVMSINPRRSNCFNFEYLSTNQATLVTKSDRRNRVTDQERMPSDQRNDCVQVPCLHEYDFRITQTYNLSISCWKLYAHCLVFSAAGTECFKVVDVVVVVRTSSGRISNFFKHFWANYQKAIE